MADDITTDLDDTLSMKLSIEPTAVTKSSLNELSGLASEILDSISEAAKAYSSMSSQAYSLRQTLSQVNADKARADSVSELAANASNTSAAKSQASVANAINSAEIAHSLNARGLDSSTGSVKAVKDNGGLQEALKRTLENENGTIADQLSIIASRLGSDIKNNSSKDASKHSKLPNILQDKDDSLISKITDVMSDSKEAPASASEPILEEDRKTSDQASDFDIEAVNKTISDNEANKAKQSTADRIIATIEDIKDNTDKLNESSDRVVANVTKANENVDDPGNFSTLDAAQQISSLFGVDSRDSVLGKTMNMASVLQEKGDQASAAGSALSSAADAARLVRAGSMAKGLAGTGAAGEAVASAGSKLSSLGSGVMSVASKAAIPLAVAAAGWTGLTKGAEFYRDVSESGRMQGESGWEAFSTGFGNKVEDKWRGLNPFSSASSDDFAMYRQMGLQSGYHYGDNTTAMTTFTQGAATMKDMGLDPRQITALFGRAIAEDPEFDVDESLKELSEAAKEAKVSVQEMADTQASLTKMMQGQIGGGEELLDQSEDMAQWMESSESIFGEGNLLGNMSDQEKAAYMSNMFNSETSQGLSAYTIIADNDELASQLEDQGVDMSDVQGVLDYALMHFDQDQLESLTQQQATFYYTEGQNVTTAKQAVKTATGYKPSSEGLRNIPDTADIAALERNNLNLNINVTTSKDIAANVETEITASNTFTGRQGYEAQKQSGKLDSSDTSSDKSTTQTRHATNYATGGAG